MNYTLITHYLGFQLVEEGTVMALAACVAAIAAVRDCIPYKLRA